MKKLFTFMFIIFGYFFILSNIANSAELYNEPYWHKKEISVFIPQNIYKNTIIEAFQSWEKCTYGKLQFNFTEKAPADIDIVLKNTVNTDENPLASYKVISERNEIKKAEIYLAISNPKIKTYSDNYILAIMKHEVGHALGMLHNPRKKISIMYSPVDENQDITKVDEIRLFKFYHWNWRTK